MTTTTIETERLQLRRLTLDDAAFIVELLNQPSWLLYIGDKGVRTLDDACRYLNEGPLAMYERHGFGLYRVGLKGDDAPIGLCGLIKRDTLEDVDIGFAFLPQYWGQGYAYEAAAATMAHGHRVLGLPRIVAIVSPGNQASIRLLEKLGLQFERTMRLSKEADEVKLYGETMT
jgi:RimJ/RimL family protein N-acetyltransferase